MTKFVRGYALEFVEAEGDARHLSQATRAVKAERMAACERIPARIRQVERITPSIVRLRVGRSFDVDEGSIARHFSDNAEDAWHGAVVESDNVHGDIYVSLENPQREPKVGGCMVEPFDFLATIETEYEAAQASSSEASASIASRLLASKGEHTTKLNQPSPTEPGFEDAWSHSWSCIWGPPGTGKTRSLGRLAAHALKDTSERILVLSSTNKSTDAAALSIVKAIRELEIPAPIAPTVIRLGSGAAFAPYVKANATEALEGSETALRIQLDALVHRYSGATESPKRAQLREDMQRLRKEIASASINALKNSDHRIIVSTLFQGSVFLGSEEIRDLRERGQAPFTTVIIDEAGLVSRAATAILSLLAARRLVLIGDPRQLSPISRQARALNTEEATWLGESGLGHLRSAKQLGPSVKLLTRQYRMTPNIRRAVSELAYDDTLQDADEVLDRPPLLASLESAPARAVWMVVDEVHPRSPVKWRAERGSGGRGWVRTAAFDVLDRLFRATPELTTMHGLYVTPYAAQAHLASAWLNDRAPHWRASTVHKQQGSEYDLVVFDTVCASATSWSVEEWRRLINVGISRARDFLVLIASRDEMQMPFLSPLASSLSSAVLEWRGSAWQWRDVKNSSSYERDDVDTSNPNLLGTQIRQLRSLRPVLSADQERLCHQKMDGRPRLVRGVAGSGKTLVLANWLCQILRDHGNILPGKIWVVFGNRALRGHLQQTIEASWKGDLLTPSVPPGRIEYRYIKDVLDDLYREKMGHSAPKGFEYDAYALHYLQTLGANTTRPRCDALFIDEAQDMGTNTLDLLFRLTRSIEHAAGTGKAIHIFYDDAQNVYKRSKPVWSKLGIDVRGRSEIMKESYRGTRPICEFALNTLYKLESPEKNEDYKEALKLQLLEESTVGEAPFTKVHFNKIDGPLPRVVFFDSEEAERDGICKAICNDIENHGVHPSDICVVYMNKDMAQKLETKLQRALSQLAPPARASLHNGGPEVIQGEDTVLIITPQSFKGYESEIVYLYNLGGFVDKDDQIHSAVIYVAMSRAKTLLKVSSYRTHWTSAGRCKLFDAVEQTLAQCSEAGHVRLPTKGHMDDLVDAAGEDMRDHLAHIEKEHGIHHSQLRNVEGEAVADPLFWISSKSQKMACFVAQPDSRVAAKVKALGYETVTLGQTREAFRLSEAAPLAYGQDSSAARSSYLREDNVTEEVWGEVAVRRGKIERSLRTVIHSGLVLRYGERTAAKKAMPCFSTRRREELDVYGFADRWQHTYFKELAVVLEKNWDCFQNLFSSDKRDVISHLQIINKYRVDAHAGTLEQEQLNVLRDALSNIETVLRRISLPTELPVATPAPSVPSPNQTPFEVVHRNSKERVPVKGLICTVCKGEIEESRPKCTTCRSCDGM
tara:strand:- start:427 stop:4611 length:4185 start_codon:yes stop_codon:yes gene_type:complete